MTLSGYFDESMRPEAGEPIAVAGYVFKPTAYKQFARTWRRLPPQTARPFHMTDLLGGKRQFADLSITIRKALLGGAIHAINQYAFAGICVLFDQTEFERTVPANWPKYFGSIYSIACQLCMRVTAHWMDAHKVFLRTDYVFEAGHKFQAEADRLLSLAGTVPELRKAYRYNGHAFREKDAAVGLQAADLLAWAATRAHVGGEMSKTVRAFAPEILTLTEGGDARYDIQFLTGQKLQLLLQEQVEQMGRPELTTRVPAHKRAFR
jgi:hypothetical protein